MLQELGMTILALTLILSGVGVVAAPSAVYSALFLTVNLLSVGVMFLTLSSQFLGVAQLLIYAGAVMVVFLFAVTVLSPDQDSEEGSWELKLGGVGVGFVAMLVLAYTLVKGGPVGSGKAQLTTVESFAAELFGKFLLPFEGTAFLLLVALMAAVILGVNRGGRNG